jgi:hypothetical protein
MPTQASAEEYRGRLERAGVRLREVRVRGVGLTLWEVSGRCRGWRLWAQGRSREDAWQSARRQAEVLGLLPPE